MASLPRTYQPKKGDCDYINLHNILLQPSMVNELQHIKPDINLSSYETDLSSSTVGTRLERITKMTKAFDDKTPLDCVHLKLVKEAQPEKYVTPWSAKNAPPKPPRHYPATPPLYSVINGRHRVVLSIAYGMTHIPAHIIKSGDKLPVYEYDDDGDDE